VAINVNPDRQTLMFNGTKLDDERTLEAYGITKEAKLELIVVSSPFESQASILQTIASGFLKIKPGPDLSSIIKLHGRVPRNYHQTLVCTEYWNPAEPIEILFDLDRLQEILMTNDNESSTFKLWKSCASYLNKEFTIMIKEKTSEKVFLQVKHNFGIILPDDLSEWDSNRQDAYLQLKFPPAAINFSPKTTYIFYFNVDNGASWEFTTSASTTSVEAVLTEEGMDLYIPTFRSNQIDWDTLLLLDDKNLKDMGIPLGPRLKLLSKIQNLKLSSEKMDSE